MYANMYQLQVLVCHITASFLLYSCTFNHISSRVSLHIIISLLVRLCFTSESNNQPTILYPIPMVILYNMKFIVSWSSSFLSTLNLRTTMPVSIFSIPINTRWYHYSMFIITCLDVLVFLFIISNVLSDSCIVTASTIYLSMYIYFYGSYY